MTDPREIAKWRLAHQNPLGQNIYVPEEALASVAPFPSLYATDFVVYLEGKGIDAQVVQYVRDLARETLWAYDNWAKAQRDADTGTLVGDMLNNCTKEDSFYAPIRKFLVDYARANGIKMSMDAPDLPMWMAGATEVAAPVPVANGASDADR